MLLSLYSHQLRYLAQKPRAVDPRNNSSLKETGEKTVISIHPQNCKFKPLSLKFKAHVLDVSILFHCFEQCLNMVANLLHQVFGNEHQFDKSFGRIIAVLIPFYIAEHTQTNTWYELTLPVHTCANS